MISISERVKSNGGESHVKKSLTNQHERVVVHISYRRSYGITAGGGDNSSLGGSWSGRGWKEDWRKFDGKSNL